MRAIYYDDYGEADVLKLGEQPEPPCGPNDVKLRVRAAGVNPIDWKMRAGELKAATAFRFPIVPGRDVAGEVIEVGANVTKFKAGERAYGMLEAAHGGYADVAVLGETVAAHIPPNLSFEEAAAVPLASLTALQALRDHGELVAGERVLVNGASGGVGTFAVQIARALNAGEVVGVCSQAHDELVKRLGVDRVIDYRLADFTAAKEQYDVIFDAVGKRSYAECKPALRKDGRYVTTLPDLKQAGGFLTSIFTEKKSRPMLVKDRGDDLHLICGWLEAGTIRPVIDKTFPLEQAAEASRYGESGRAGGKIVLSVGN